MFAIEADHPLFRELRSGLLWHCTSPQEYRQILKDELIKPNDGRVQKWGNRPYACQELGGVSLFDFSTEPEQKVLQESVKWQQFIGVARPLTIILGMKDSQLSGRLVRYPDSLTNTTGNVIPWVEVCHCGAIPITAITKFLLVCSADYTLFSSHQELTDEVLSKAEKKFSERLEILGKEHEEKFKHIKLTRQQIEMEKAIKLAQHLAKERFSE